MLSSGRYSIVSEPHVVLGVKLCCQNVNRSLGGPETISSSFISRHARFITSSYASSITLRRRHRRLMQYVTRGEWHLSWNVTLWGYP